MRISEPLSLKSVQVPGLENQTADCLSRGGPTPGECRLHLEVVAKIWSFWNIRSWTRLPSGSRPSASCSLWGGTTPSVQTPWPTSGLKAFCTCPPQLVLIVPNWPHMALFSDIPLLICGAPRELRFWRDLLAQAQRTLGFALSAETLALDLASERTSFLAMHLSRMVIQTLQGAWGCKTAADSVWPSCQLRGL